jgi:hypothetical protein
MRLLKFLFLGMLFISLNLYAQNTAIETITDYQGWGQTWETLVMKNGLITVATVPVIGARTMQYDLG